MILFIFTKNILMDSFADFFFITNLLVITYLSRTIFVQAKTYQRVRRNCRNPRDVRSEGITFLKIFLLFGGIIIWDSISTIDYFGDIIDDIHRIVYNFVHLK